MSPPARVLTWAMLLLAAAPAVAQPIDLRPAPSFVASAPTLIQPPLAPSVTYALLPGHWQLRRARYVWVPPETRLRRVETRPFVQGRYVWRDGRWTWVPPHYANIVGE